MTAPAVEELGLYVGDMKKINLLGFAPRAAWGLLLFMLAFGAVGLVRERRAQASGTPISLTAVGVTVPDNFDSLANTGTANTTLPTGWGFVEAGTNANTTYAADTGAGTGGNTYSFGAAASTERAFGELTSGTLQSTFGACFTNNTGGNIGAIEIAYTGEQWRSGDTANVPDRLDFQYSLNATSLGDVFTLRDFQVNTGQGVCFDLVRVEHFLDAVEANQGLCCAHRILLCQAP